MRNKIIFTLAVLGIIAGLLGAYFYTRQKPSLSPVFSPASNPYSRGIYANGIVESYQTNGENINLFPEVSGVVTQIFVTEGESVKKGAILLTLDDSVQRATAEQQKAQSEAALSALEELKAQPRKETLEVVKAQMSAAAANLKNVEDQFKKLKKSYHLNPRSVSKNDLDNALNAVKIGQSNFEVARKQYELTRAGAWSYDIKNQQKQYDALVKSYAASSAQLAKYAIKAPMDGVVLSIKVAVGSYVSAQGTYGTYTEGFTPVLVMGGSEVYLQVRCYVDEILVHRLPSSSQMKAQLFIRGTNIRIPLEFIRVQPYVTPKIELSDQRAERVDVRVLPILFKFEKPKDVHIYPGQLVDVYIGERESKAESRNQFPVNSRSLRKSGS